MSEGYTNSPTTGLLQVTKLAADGGKISHKLDITQQREEPKEYRKIDVISQDSDDSTDLSGDEINSDDSYTEDDYDNDSSDSQEQEDVNNSPLSGGKGVIIDSDNESTTSSVSTTEILGRDPLFLVLSEFLMDDEGNNIVHILQKINKNLSKIAKSLDKESNHKPRKSKHSDK